MTSGFVPAYTREESVYSWIVRFSISQPYLSWRSINRELFEQEYVRIHPVLPCHLDQISGVSGSSIEELITHGTGFPLFRSMEHNPQWAEKLKAVMRSNDGPRIAAISNISSSRLPFISSLKFCAGCMEESSAKDEIPLWYTKHQLYGVHTCTDHNQILNCCRAGEGGINHVYAPPGHGLSTMGKDIYSETLNHLSRTIVSLFELAKQTNALPFTTQNYERMLTQQGYITPCGHLRWKKLQQDLIVFWSDIFKTKSFSSFSAIQDFHFIPNLVHNRQHFHYFKHALLIGFLCENPKEIVEHSEIPSSEYPTNSNTSDSSYSEQQLVTLLASGKSLRKIASITNRSVGYLKQLALRNSIPTGSRIKFITPEISRSIWREAFVGKHRADIAKKHNVSVGAVEQIIQRHPRLSQWRKHLRRANRLMRYRECISTYISRHEAATRKQIRSAHGKEYIWLYKNDRQWLEEHLPARSPRKHYPSIHWPTKDRELEKIIKAQVKSGKSLSDIDRQIGGHHWLTKYRRRLPLSVAAANDIIENGESKNG